MPIYPALALLLGSAMAMGGIWIRRGTRALAVITGCAAAATLIILFLVRTFPNPGDISRALTEHPDAYTLSLGHMEDLTLRAFAYLRTPLALASVAFLIGCAGAIWGRQKRAFFAAAVMMVLFFQAARLAMVVFDPYMSSRPLANAFLHSPSGEMITQQHYYPFSSIFFYTNRRGLLLNGRAENLEYGSNAPGAAHVFIDDAQFKKLWSQPERYYLFAEAPEAHRIERFVNPDDLNVVAASGGKLLLTNHPFRGTHDLAAHR